MEIKRCERGHFYDAQANSACPQCAAEAAHGVNGFVMNKPMDYGKTEPVVPINAARETEPVVPISEIGPTKPVMPTETLEPTKSKDSISDITVPEPATIAPVVGWLVCIEGASRGMDYRICAGYNNIGSGDDMDICIKGDSQIIENRHAQIAYDPKEREFFFGQALGKDIIRVNDVMVMMPQKLSAQDVLTIGSTKLLFVPLCTEGFDWND